jgi:outer membrane lipoprotein-sorting protein
VTNGQVLRLVRFAAVVIAGMCVLSCACNAAEFSAERVIKEGRMTVTSKCYFKGSSTRSDTTMGSEKRIVINRPDKGVLWMLDPAKKEYDERKCQPAYTDYIQKLVKQGGKKKLVKTEMVSGQNCDRYSISFPNTGRGPTTVWVSKKLGRQIKMQSASQCVIYKNIKEGKLSDSLFEVPKGYKKR